MEENLKYKTKKSIYWTAINNFTNYGLQFVVGIIMARMLTPEDYGITALPAVFIAVANVFIDSGFGGAMIRKPDLTEKDLSTAFYYSLGVGVFCYLLIFLFAPFIANFFDTPILEPLVRITALTFLWGPLATPQNILLNRNLNFKSIAYIQISTKIVGATIGILMAYKGYGLWSLVVMGVVSSFIECILKWITVKWVPKERWSKASFNYLWGFGNKMLLSSLIDKIYSNITPVIVGKFFSKTELGLYNRAQGYASLPSVQSTNIIQSVTFPVLSKVQDNDEVLRNNYRKMIKTTAFIVFPIMTIFAGVAKPLIILLITDKWIDAIILLQLMCFSSMWYPVHSLNLNLLLVKGKSNLFLRLEIWKKLLGLIIMACALPFGLKTFVTVGIFSSFLSLFINSYFTERIINYGFFQQMKDLFPTYILSVAVFGIIWVFSLFITNLWILLFGGCLLGVLIYLGTTFVLKFSELEDVKYLLTKKH